MVVISLKSSHLLTFVVDAFTLVLTEAWIGRQWHRYLFRLCEEREVLALREVVSRRESAV